MSQNTTFAFETYTILPQNKLKHTFPRWVDLPFIELKMFLSVAFYSQILQHSFRYLNTNKFILQEVSVSSKDGFCQFQGYH